MSKYFLKEDIDSYDEDTQDGEYNFFIKDKKGKTVGWTAIEFIGEEGCINNFNLDIPLTIRIKNDLLKSLKDIDPGVKYLSGYRISGSRKGSLSKETSIPIERGYKILEEE